MKAMNRFILTLALLAAPLALTACAEDAPAPIENAPATAAAAAVAPRMEDGVQVIDIEAGSMGFQPREFTL